MCESFYRIGKMRLYLHPKLKERCRSGRTGRTTFFPLHLLQSPPQAGGDVRPSGANPPERASSRHIRTWMCDHREQTPSEGVTEIPVSPTLSEGVTRSLAVPVWNRCCCGNSYSSVLGRGCQAMNLPATVNGKYCSTSDL